MTTKAPSRLEKRYLLGLVLALAAAFSYGAGQVLAKKVVSELVPPTVGAFYAIVFGLVGLFFLGLRDLRRDLRAPRDAHVYVLLSGVFASLGFLFSFIALSHAPVVVVSPVSSVSPLVSVALSALFLRSLERVGWRLVLGAVLVVVGVVLVVLGSSSG